MATVDVLEHTRGYEPGEDECAKCGDPLRWTDRSYSVLTALSGWSGQTPTGYEETWCSNCVEEAERAEKPERCLTCNRMTSAPMLTWVQGDCPYCPTCAPAALRIAAEEGA